MRIPNGVQESFNGSPAISARKNCTDRAQQSVIPPQASSAFVAAMEDILAVHKRPRDGDCPLVCLDETSKQLLADTRTPIPIKPGQPERRDYEYEPKSAVSRTSIGETSAGAVRAKSIICPGGGPAVEAATSAAARIAARASFTLKAPYSKYRRSLLEFHVTCAERAPFVGTTEIFPAVGYR
jgi:hypothetical protein